MTRATRDYGALMQEDAISSVSADAKNGFAEYKIGPNHIIIDPVENVQSEGPSLKETIAKETAYLLEQQERLSVRDLAKKFESGLAAVEKLSEEAKWRDIASLDRHVLLKKLIDVLESLRGRVAGRNKDDMEEAISMVEALAVQLTQREGELLHEKIELKKLANVVKQTSEDAKRLVEQERASARTEIERARAAVQRVEQALYEQEKSSISEQKQDIEELMREVQEARRIKMLHQPSRVMDMEHELQALRIQLSEKCSYIVQLRKELSMCQKLEENEVLLFHLEGLESLGSCLRAIPRGETAPDLSDFPIQWYRMLPDGSKKELIAGATKSVYAPEPFDVGRILQAEVMCNDRTILLSTSGPIDQAAGLGSYVEALMRKPDTEFNVAVVQMNGRDYSSNAIHVFHVGKMRIKLRKGKTTKAKETYSTSMQLCGIRGGGNAAAMSLFWQARRGHSFTLAFETERERNAAIMLARRFAFDCNIMLSGPGDRSPVGT